MRSHTKTFKTFQKYLFGHLRVKQDWNSSKRKMSFSPNDQAFCLSHIVCIVWNIVLHDVKQQMKLGKYIKYKARLTHNFFLFGSQSVKVLHSKLEGSPVKFHWEVGRASVPNLIVRLNKKMVNSRWVRLFPIKQPFVDCGATKQLIKKMEKRNDIEIYDYSLYDIRVTW